MEIANHAFTIVFATELVLKAAGQTSREFWQHGVTSGINCFETLIVGCGLLELAKFLMPAGDLANGFGIFPLARFLRVLRVFRLVTAVPKMRQIVDILISTSWNLVYVCMLIGMVLFIYSMLGMQLFGGKLVDEGGVDSPRGHWDTARIAFLTTFQIMTLDGWSKLLEDTVGQMGMVYVVYFISWIFVGSFVLMKLLLVIILEAYATTQAAVNLKNHELRKEWKEERKWKNKTGPSKSLLRANPDGFDANPLGTVSEDDEMMQSQGVSDDSDDSLSRSRERARSPVVRQLSQFTTSNDAMQATRRVDDAARHKARAFISNEVTQEVYIVFVVLSCVFIAMDKPW